jgi:hypothetical protein
MRLADDTRGRVPFALLGVVLLVTSATVATTQLTTTPDAADPAVDRAMRETTAATRTALHDAVATAARDAARDPVTRAAATPYGAVLNDSETFEDALRVRIALAARERLAAVAGRAGPVTASATLPAVDSPADLRSAKRAVRVERAGPNGTALRVRIDGVRLSAARAGRVVGERRVAPTVTVAVPVLELHDRVGRFERRLDAGLGAPGFDRRFTAGTYALAWVRGAAQHRGAPVANVLGNDHVELAANDAALGVQRATLGGIDPAADGDLATAWGRALATDLAPGALPGPVVDETLDRTETGLRRLDEGVREERVTVSPGAAADAALAGLNRSTVARIVERAYGVDARLVSAVGPADTTVEREPRPGSNWTRVRATTRTDRSVLDAGAGAPGLSTPDGWTAFERYDRRVVVRETTTTRWRRDDRVRETTTVRTRVRGVSLAVVGRHSPASRVARRGVTPLYERGGALDGPNLAGVPDRAVERLVADRGGADALAGRAAGGSLDTAPVRLVGERPAALRSWLAADRAALDRRVRNVSLSLSRVDVGTFATSPPARLAARIRAERAALLDAPSTYDGVADGARVAVRRAYLDRLLAALDERAEARASRRGRLNAALGERNGSLAEVRRSLDVATDRPPATSAGPAAGLGGPLSVTVDTAPSYLSIEATARERFGDGAGTVTPLDARNLNWVTVPYGDAAGRFADLVAGPDRVSLRSAAETLRAERRAGNASGVAGAEREALRGAVRDATAAVEGRLADALAAEGACSTTSDCRGVVDAALDRWGTPAGRALALVDGSAADEVAATASVPAADRRRLAARLRTTLREGLAASEARPPSSAVSPVADGLRADLHGAVEEAATDAGGTATDRALQRTLGRTLDDVPLGVPLVPIPGYWYATMNGWSVSVEGTYERLAVRSRRGARDTVYVRDGSPVALDVDADGAVERLGTAPNLSFEASTTVVVVVPPGPRGVADVDGTRDERSPGYE